MEARYFKAKAFNQYGREVGWGTGITKAKAAEMARLRFEFDSKDRNPNWKWKIVKMEIREMT